jgi:hypothetical protein
LSKDGNSSDNDEQVNEETKLAQEQAALQESCHIYIGDIAQRYFRRLVFLNLFFLLFV